MLHAELSRIVIEHRRMLTEKTRNMVIRALGIREVDNDCILTMYREFFLQISFSEVHPLMVFCLSGYPLKLQNGFIGVLLVACSVAVWC